jgi:hypothetical protein
MIHGGKRWKYFWLHIAAVELVLFSTYGIIRCPRDKVHFLTNIIAQMASLSQGRIRILIDCRVMFSHHSITMRLLNI